MKAIYTYCAGAIAVTFGLAACIPGPAPSPTPEPPAPQSVQTTQAAPAPAAVAENWLDTPQTAGDWQYTSEANETFALFVDNAGGTNNYRAIIRCDLAKREIGLGVFGSASGGESLRVVTETADRTLRALERPAQPQLIGAVAIASDPLFDAIALTRGRFVLAASGKPALYLPAWAEVTRVIEDCR